MRKKSLAQDDKTERVASQPIGVPAEFGFYFVERANENVEGKGRGVNSVFLVQLRKRVGMDFRGSERIKNRVEDTLVTRLRGGGLRGEEACVGKYARVGRRFVHRGCTGNAERGVGSDLWSEVGLRVVIEGEWV
jgi:hypothetical protein